jgi:hypothetical protein
MKQMQKGSDERTTAATAVNDHSSRSHAIFTVTLTIKQPSQNISRVAKINLVDLAGSERAYAAVCKKENAMHFKEATCINQSLSTLARVIDALIDRTKSSKLTSSATTSVPPYRDSLLTWLLSDSLGGNAKTIMVATISPAPCNFEETLSTLRYASRARSVVNVCHVNHTDDDYPLVRELRDEIQFLKTLNLTQNGASVSEMQKKYNDLQRKLAESEAEIFRLRQQLTENGIRNSNKRSDGGGAGGGDINFISSNEMITSTTTTTAHDTSSDHRRSNNNRSSNGGGGNYYRTTAVINNNNIPAEQTLPQWPNQGAAEMTTTHQQQMQLQQFATGAATPLAASSSSYSTKSQSPFMPHTQNSNQQQRPYFGIEVMPEPLDNKDSGLAVISTNGPSAHSGLRQGDAILYVNGTQIVNTADFRNILAKTKPGDSISLYVRRGHHLLTLSVCAGICPETSSASTPCATGAAVTQTHFDRTAGSIAVSPAALPISYRSTLQIQAPRVMSSTVVQAPGCSYASTPSCPTNFSATTPGGSKAVIDSQNRRVLSVRESSYFVDEHGIRVDEPAYSSSLACTPTLSRPFPKTTESVATPSHAAPSAYPTFSSKPTESVNTSSNYASSGLSHPTFSNNNPLTATTSMQSSTSNRNSYHHHTPSINRGIIPVVFSQC